MKKKFALFTLIFLFSISNFSLHAQNSSKEIEEANKRLMELNDGGEIDLDDGGKSDPKDNKKKRKGKKKKKNDNDKNDNNDKNDDSDEDVEVQDFHQTIKTKFMEGGPQFMGIVLLCLILGLALSIERIIYLNLASTNTNKLLTSVEDALKNGGVKEAKEVCRNTRGPVASIFYQGLERSSEGIDQVEKSVIAYGGVQMGLLEKGLSWISLFIAIAPMLGFMGTVIGMIDAFDAIQTENDISPGLVAGGIKTALLTTVFGLIVAIVLQIFYNYLVSKIDSIVNDMEDASISLIDMLVNNKK